MDDKQYIISTLKYKSVVMNMKFNLIDKLKLSRCILLYSKIHKIKKQLKSIDLIRLNFDLRIYDYIIMSVLQSNDKNYIVTELNKCTFQIEKIIKNIDNNYLSIMTKDIVKDKLQNYYKEEQVEEISETYPSPKELEIINAMSDDYQCINEKTNNVVDIKKYRTKRPYNK